MKTKDTDFEAKLKGAAKELGTTLSKLCANMGYKYDSINACINNDRVQPHMHAHLDLLLQHHRLTHNNKR